MSNSDTEQADVALKFADEHQGDLRTGEKTVTVRLQSDCPRIVPGIRMRIQDEDGDPLTLADVETTVPLRLKYAHHLVSLADGYPAPGTLEEYIETLQGYYPDHDITPESRVLVVFFEVTTP